MFLVLLMVFQISVAMAVGFVLGRIWQIRYDMEQQLAFTRRRPPPAYRAPEPEPAISCKATH
jgi:hypothetical protein